MPRPWKRPDIPQGPLADLNNALHDLHHRSGWLSAREIRRALNDKGVSMSHTKVHDTLTKPALPGKGAVEFITEVLAETVRGADASAEVARVLVLWDAASITWEYAPLPSDPAQPDTEPVLHEAPPSSPSSSQSVLADAESGIDHRIDDSTHSAGAARALQTLRALRAQRAAQDGRDAGSNTEDRSSVAQQFRSVLLGPGRTLRRPSFSYPPKAPAVGEYPLADLVEGLFRSWPDLERTVAAKRLFATDPVSLRVLSEQIAVDVRDVLVAERQVKERLLSWLNSAEGAPLTGHLRELSEQMGSASTIDRLINAHPEHPVEVPSLDAPLWRVVAILLTEWWLHDGWLIADDPDLLRRLTCELLRDGPGLTEAAIRLQRIGIRAQEIRTWLLSVPGVSIQEGRVVVDPTAPL